MGALEFAADTVVSASVLGTDATWQPSQVEKVLGTDFEVGHWHSSMWRSYGVAEFFWERAAQGSWRNHHFSVQIHRLSVNQIRKRLNKAIKKRYGKFESVLLFSELTEALKEKGVPLIELSGASSGYREYWQPDSSMSILVIDSGEEEGQVYGIYSEQNAAAAADRQYQNQHSAFEQKVDQLLNTSEGGRVKWLTRYLPEVHERPNWWRYLCTTMENLVHQRTDQQHDLAKLYFWTLAQSESNNGLTPAETALCTAHFIAAIQRRFSGSTPKELVGTLPATDAVIQRCLSVLPLTGEEFHAPLDLNHPNLESVARKHSTRELVDATLELLEHTDNEELEHEVHEWSRTIAPQVAN
jgi:hypothetical protein